ncbi:MAG: sigma-70 family RNA polymerase sigma factor [Planctomycetota bacterium]|nr:sigma-70 family RNA polymerase sigma factor [Planctomycetota bacterium]
MRGDELVSFLKRPTRRRFTRLVQTHRDAVLSAAYRVLGDPHAAEDVTQEVFVKILAAKWRPEGIRSAKGLLVSTAVLTALTRLRADERRLGREFRSARDECAERPITLDDIIDVREAVLDLPEGLRAVVDLRYFGGLTVREVATTLGCSYGAVKGRLERARALLRDRLGPRASLTILPALVPGASPGESPGLQPSDSLKRQLDRLSRDGVSCAVIAAGSSGSSSGTWAMSIAAALVVVAGLWLSGGFFPSRRLGEPPSPGDAALEVATPAEQGRSPARSADTPVKAESTSARRESSPPRPYRVIDRRNRPIDGVRVTFTASWPAGRVPPTFEHAAEPLKDDPATRMWTQFTDREGGLDFPKGAGSLSLRLSKEGFLTQRVRFSANLPPPGPAVVLYEARECALQVIDRSGAPVDSYRLTIDFNFTGSRPSFLSVLGDDSPLRTAPVEVEVNDAEGIYRFWPQSVDWGYGVTVEADGYPPHHGKYFEYEFRDDGGRDLVMTLEDRRVHRGVVVDPYGNPVADAKVYASNAQDPLQLGRREGLWRSFCANPPVECAPDGTFAIAEVPGAPGGTWIAAVDERLSPAWTRVSPGGARWHVLALGEGGSFEAIVLDEKGDPRPGERVRIRLVGLDGSPGPIVSSSDLLDRLRALPITGSFSLYTGQDGRARFEDLLPGTYLWSTPTIRRQFEVRRGETSELVDRAPLAEPETQPASRARIGGRITLAGEPFAMAPENTQLMVVAHRDVVTDSQGFYAIEGVPPGEYFAQDPFLLPTGTLAALIPFEVVTTQTELEFSWNYPLCRVGGRIVDEHGQHVSGAQLEVRIFDSYGRTEPEDIRCLRHTAETDSKGAFLCSQLLSTGNFALTARAPGRRRQTQRLDIDQECPGQLELEFRLLPARNRLRLVLVEEETGRPLEADNGIQVGLGRLETGESLLEDEADEYGERVWTGLDLGVYSVSVDPWGRRGRGFVYDEIAITKEVGSTEAYVKLPPGGSLIVVVQDTSGRRFARPFPQVALSRVDGAPAVPPRFQFSAQQRGDKNVFRQSVDPYGRLKLIGLPVGIYEVRVDRRSFSSSSQRIEIRKGLMATVEVTLVRRLERGLERGK